MEEKLAFALKQVCEMKHPSIAQILKSLGYDYESVKMEDLVEAFENSN